MNCELCSQDAGVMPDESDVRMCGVCRDKLRTHYAFVCDCANVYWLPKTPTNVVFVAEHEGINVLEAGKIGVIGIPMCKFCGVSHAETVH